MAVRLQIVYRDPRELLAEAERTLDGIPSHELFNTSKHQKLRECWCAAMFGIGYSQHVTPCQVAVNDDRYREDVDFFVRIAELDCGFQLAEVQRPDRRRGHEYRKFADGGLHLLPYQPGHGGQHGPQWLAAAVDKKIAKRYASSNDLNLLLYANFDGAGIEYSILRARMADYSSHFASLWVVSSLQLCSVFSSPVMGAVQGWGVIRDVREYYAQGPIGT